MGIVRSSRKCTTDIYLSVPVLCQFTLFALLNGIHGRHTIEAQVQYLNHISPRVLYVHTGCRSSRDLNGVPLSASSVLNDRLGERFGVGVRHADMEEARAVILEVDGIRLEARVEELEYLKADAVARRHVSQLDFVEVVTVDGENGSRGVL